MQLCCAGIRRTYFRHRTCLRTYHSQHSILQDLQTRELVADVTRPADLEAALRKKQTVYTGIDPTANALHVGHLLPLMCLLHFQVHGHQVISLVGGATGRVGDPSGRLTERTPIKESTIDENVDVLSSKVSKFFTNALEHSQRRGQLRISEDEIFPPIVMNNLSWFRNLGLLDFLRMTGVHARVSTMLARESVQSRMTSQHGISFTEFSYQLLQAYDFYELHSKMGCTIQIGGSDQWGNILAGIDLINRQENVISGHSSEDSRLGFGLTTPLLTTASGDKFGKSAGNAVWLDKELTSVFDFYQFFLRTSDGDVEKYLKMFTLLPVLTIQDTIKEHETSPQLRSAQRLLAEEVTDMVHGVDGIRQARAATQALFETDLGDVRANDVISALSGDPRLVFCDSDVLLNTQIAKLASLFGLASSATAARKLVRMNGLYLNNQRVEQPDYTLTRDQLIDGRLAILRAGKEKHLILALT